MEARDVTDHDVGMLHADIQRLREQIESRARWALGLIFVVVVTGLVSIGGMFERVEQNAAKVAAASARSEQVEGRVAKLEGDRDLLGERMSTLRDAILTLSADVREMLARERERGAGWRGGKQE